MVKKIIPLIVMFFLSLTIVLAACPEIQEECITEFENNPTIETFNMIQNPTLTQFNKLQDVDKIRWVRDTSDFDNVRHLSLANNYFTDSATNVNQNRDKFKEFVKKSTNSLDVLEFTGNINSFSKNGVLSGKSGSININDFKGRTGSILGISIVNGNIEVVHKKSKKALSFTGDLRREREGTFSLPKGSLNGKNAEGVTAIRLRSDGSVDGKLKGYDGVTFDKPTPFKTKPDKSGFEVVVLDKAEIKSTKKGTKTKVKGSAKLKGLFKDMKGALTVAKGYTAKLDDVEITAEEDDVEVVVKEKSTESDTTSAYQRWKEKASEGLAGIVEISDKLVVAGEGVQVTTTAEGLIKQEKKATGQYNGYLKLPSRGYYKKGDKSEQVKIIQNLVGVKPSGVYDSATTEAVKRWQEQTFRTTGVCGGKLSGSKCYGDGAFGSDSRNAYLKLNSGSIVTKVKDGATVIANSPTRLDVRSTGKSDLKLGGKQYEFKDFKDGLKVFQNLGGKVKTAYDQIDFDALVPQETPGTVSDDVIDIERIKPDLVKTPPTEEAPAPSSAEEKVDSLEFWEAKKEVARYWDRAIEAAEDVRKDIIESAREQAKTAPETVEPEIVEEEARAWDFIAGALRSAKKDDLKKDVEKPEVYGYDFKEKVGKKIGAFMEKLEQIELPEPVPAEESVEVQEAVSTPTKKIEFKAKRREVANSWHEKVTEMMRVEVEEAAEESISTVIPPSEPAPMPELIMPVPAEEVATAVEVAEPVEETTLNYWDKVLDGVSEFIGDIPVVDNVEAYDNPDYSYGDVLSEDDIDDNQDIITDPVVEDVPVFNLPDLPEIEIVAEVPVVDLPDASEIEIVADVDSVPEVAEDDGSIFGISLDDVRDLIVVNNPDLDAATQPVEATQTDVVSGGCDTINQECYVDSMFIPKQMSIPAVVTLEGVDGEEIAKLEQEPPKKEKPLKIVKMGKRIYPLREGEAYVVAAGQTSFTRAVAPNLDAPELKDLSYDERKKIVDAGHMAIMYVDEGGEVRVTEADWSGVTDKPLKKSYIYKKRGTINGIYGFKNADSEKIIQGSKLDARKNIGWFFKPVDASGAGIWNAALGKNYNSYRSCVSHICTVSSYGGVDLTDDLTYLPPRGGSLSSLQSYVEGYGFPSSGNGLKNSRTVATMLKMGIETQVGRTPELATPSQVIHGGLTNGLIEEVKPVSKNEAKDLLAQQNCPPGQIC